jgi:hypothetical protein
MRSGFSWQKWRRTLSALFFIVQYYCRMSLLALRYKARNLSHAEIAEQAHEHWNRLCQALTTPPTLKTALRNTKERLESEQFTGALRALRQNLEDERLHTTLEKAKKKLEQLVFVEEGPTQPIDRSSLEKLKTVWHTLETSKIPRITPDALKTARQTLETRKIVRIMPDTIRAARRPLKTLRTLRRRTTALMTLCLAALMLVTLFGATGLLNQALHTMKTLGLSSVAQLSTSELNIKAHQAPAVNASKALVRISQLDESQYASPEEYNTWAYSACSTASMTEVLNAYGYHYRITDVLKVEARLGEITPQLGLVENVGIANTAAQFGFQTAWGTNWTLDQVIQIANLGRPVIVGWPPQRYDGGHIVVVTGGDSNNVYLADSSLWNRHVLSRAQFLQWWAGFAAVMMPA